MRVTINLAKTSGPRELVEVLRAADAVKPARASKLDPLELLTTTIHRAVTLALNKLERAIHRRVCRYVTRKRGDRFNQRRQTLQQKLFA